MKKVRHALLLSSFFVIYNFSASAQTTFEIPKNVTLSAKEDYAKYESDIVRAANWLEATDLDKEKSKRKEIAAFVVTWISGSPTVTIELKPELLKLYDKNEDLLTIFLASYSKYCIEHKTDATKTNPTKAAIVSMINVYKKGIKIRSNKEMDKVVKLSSEELDKYVTENFE